MKTQITVQKYDWGVLRIIHRGPAYSVVIHPQHYEMIETLGDVGGYRFKDETGRSWEVRRRGDWLHFRSDSYELEVEASGLEVADA